MRPLITLTTDFGLDDPFVGIMKGVILNIEPSARIIDITHNIEPHNILQAARVLNATYPWYPKKTIHIVVVDPDVGGAESSKNSITKKKTSHSKIPASLLRNFPSPTCMCFTIHQDGVLRLMSLKTISLGTLKKREAKSLPN